MANHFRFGLEALKKLRENKLQIAKRDFFILDQKLQELKNSKLSLLQSRKDFLEDLHTKVEDSQQIQGHALLVENLTQQMRNRDREIIDVEAEYERQKSWVTHLGRELKIVEKLEEKQRAEFEESQLKIEKRKMDQWVSERWGHKINLGY